MLMFNSPHIYLKKVVSVLETIIRNFIVYLKDVINVSTNYGPTYLKTSNHITSASEGLSTLVH